jgi:hypothetical protein
MKYIIAPPEYDEPDRIKGNEPNPRWVRYLVLGFAAFWATIILGIALIWSCSADAQGRLVFLEDERDLDNGLKLCIYSEGVTITIPSYQLCPISIEV